MLFLQCEENVTYLYKITHKIILYVWFQRYGK